MAHTIWALVELPDFFQMLDLRPSKFRTIFILNEFQIKIPFFFHFKIFTREIHDLSDASSVGLSDSHWNPDLYSLFRVRASDFSNAMENKSRINCLHAAYLPDRNLVRRLFGILRLSFRFISICFSLIPDCDGQGRFYRLLRCYHREIESYIK